MAFKSKKKKKKRNRKTIQSTSRLQREEAAGMDSWELKSHKAVWMTVIYVFVPTKFSKPCKEQYDLRENSLRSFIIDKNNANFIVLSRKDKAS